MQRGGRLLLGVMLLAGAAFVAAPAPAQQSDALKAIAASLPGRLLNDPTRLDWDIYGQGKSTKGVKSPSIPGGQAVQITIPRAGEAAHSVGVNIPVKEGIRAGTDVLAAFWARTVSADLPDGKGRIGVRFQQNATPWPGFGDTMVTVGPEWQLVEVTARADRDIPGSTAVVALQVAGAKQVLEIGQAIVLEGVTTLKPAGGPALPPALEGKGTLIHDPSDRASWGTHGTGLTARPGTGRSVGGSSTIYTMAAALDQPHMAGITIPLKEKLETGDILIVAVEARATQPAAPETGVLGLRVQHNRPPWNGFGDATVKLGPNWRLVQLRTQSKFDIPAGEAAVSLHLGGAKQEVEIGNVFVLREPVP